jgi:hypothetical protein
MRYTVEQLLQIYHSPQSGWIMLRNDDIEDPTADVSEVVPGAGAVESDGVWKIHVSIKPADMPRAIPLLHEEFCDAETPPMGMKIASEALLAEDHQSSKEVALIFDRATETSNEGRRKIILFLASLATRFTSEKILPEPSPPLMVGYEDYIHRHGSQADKRNLEHRKFDAPIRYSGGEGFSYFYYRDETALVFDDATYDEMVSSSSPEECSRMQKASEVDKSKRKHNPLNREDDFLYGVNLQMIFGFSAFTKKQIFKVLEETLQKPETKRVNILDLFSQIKIPYGVFAPLHQSRNPKWDSFRLRYFKASVPAQPESFWHTATYQAAVKLLKDAYLAREDDQTDINRQAEATALIDYRRGIPMSSAKETKTRKKLKG